MQNPHGGLADLRAAEKRDVGDSGASSGIVADAAISYCSADGHRGKDGWFLT